MTVTEAFHPFLQLASVALAGLLLSAPQVLPQHVDMRVPQWRKSGFILFIYGFTFITSMIQCSLHIDGIPENDSICHQPQRTQQILLPILIAFPTL